MTPTVTDLSRITSPLRLAVDSHQAGSGQGCGMNVVSWINGDTVITDYPDCSARPLARLVQIVNDGICTHRNDDLLCPDCSRTVIDLGVSTMGTADVPRTVVWAWLAELLDSPEWGVTHYAQGSAPAVVGRVADLCRRAAGGGVVSDREWWEARAAAFAASDVSASASAAHAVSDGNAYASIFAAGTASDVVSDASAYSSSASASAVAAVSGATAYAPTSAADAASDVVSAAGAYVISGASAADAASDAASGASVSAVGAASDVSSKASAVGAASYAATRLAHARQAITAWRRLAGLDTPTVTPKAVDGALRSMAEVAR